MLISCLPWCLAHLCDSATDFVALTLSNKLPPLLSKPDCMSIAHAKADVKTDATDVDDSNDQIPVLAPESNKTISGRGNDDDAGSCCCAGSTAVVAETEVVVVFEEEPARRM